MCSTFSLCGDERKKMLEFTSETESKFEDRKAAASEKSKRIQAILQTKMCHSK